MSTIHLLLDNGEQVTFREEEVRELLVRKSIAEHTPFWREGMLQWRPLAELDNPVIAPHKRTDKPITNVPIPGSLRAGTGAVEEWERPVANFYLRVNPLPFTITYLILTAISMAGLGWFIYHCLEILYGWNVSLIAPVKAGDVCLAEENSLLVYFFVLLGLHIATEAVFFFWLFDANKNSRSMATNIRYTPGWSVGCFFVPIVNCYVPYQVVQEIWKVADDPRSWNGRRDSIYVALWFLARLSMGLLLWGLLRTNSADDDAAILALGTVGYLATVLGVFLAIELTTFLLVLLVTWWQMRWARGKLEEEAED